MKKNIILSAALMFTALTAQAQTTITFDSAEPDYKAISVYDSWEESPFRAETPVIDFEAEVADNPDKSVDEVLGAAPNATDKVVKLRRSRHGSNTFGVRIDLKEPIRVTKQLQYIHIMAYLKDKPTDSRMMVIGLGNRLEESWEWQTGEDEQFWATTTSNIKPKAGWQDIVVSFKGFSYSKEEKVDSGIDIHSLVIVPDVRSPHADAEDWYAYIDEIVVDNNPDKRFTTEKYALTYEKDAKATHGSRRLNGVGLTSAGVSYSSATATGDKMGYYDNTTMSVFSAKAGAEVQPTFNYSGTWMSGYVYVDWNNDGRFDYAVNDDGTPAEGSEIVSYSAAQIGDTWYKSDGTTRDNGNAIGSPMPTFTIPEGTAPGFYRMRYKVDWNSLNPAGGSTLLSDGGGIVDVMLDVHGSEVLVSASQLNGDIVLAEDESVLQSYSTEYGQPLKVKIVPAPGFVQYGFALRYGYNVNAAQQLDDNGNPNWIEVNVPYTAITGDGTYHIPAEYMRGSQVSIKGDMQQEQLYTVEVVGLEGQGGVVYANIETTDGGTVRATQFFSAEQVQPIAVEDYDGTININDRVITVTYTLSGLPCREVTTLSELKNYKLYQIKAKSGEGYLAYNSGITTEYVSLRGVTSSPNGLPNNADVAAKYQEEVSPFDETVVWQIILEDGKYYLYQPERNAYVTRSGRDYKFTETKTALDGIRANSEDGYVGTFSFHAGGGYSDASTNFACIVTNEATVSLRNWTWNDHGSVMQIIENPNVYTLDYTVEIIGHADGAIIYDEVEYANGSTLTTTEFFTAEDVVVKTVGLYTSEVTLDKESQKITVQYIAPKVVTSINPEMFYTLECKATDHDGFIGDNGTVINGRSAEPTFLMFEPGETEGTYYIKSVVSGRYLNCDGSTVTASATRTTAWIFGVGGKDNVANVVTFGIAGYKYLNNNHTGTSSDGSCSGLKPNPHGEGPGSGNACSLWQMCEFEPTYNNYQVAILGADAATVTFDGEQYENGATIKTFDFIQASDITAAGIDGKIVIINVEEAFIYVSYIDADTQFYTIRHNGGSYVSLNPAYTDANGNLKLTNNTTVSDSKGLWAFASQEDGGYKIYNYTTGLFKVLGMTGNEGNARASMVAHDNTTHTTTFYGTLNLENGDASFIRVASSGNNYWNYRDGFLALWNHSNAGSGDGSKFFMTPVDYAAFFTPETVTIGEYEIATFYANTSVYIPEGVKAYVATEVPVMEDEKGTILITQLESIIPAKTGVVLRGAEGEYSFVYTAQAGTPVTGNLLRGYAGSAAYTEVELPTDGSVNYVFAAPDGEEVGFHCMETSFKVYNHEAYLNVPAVQGVSSLAIRFADEEDTTGIEPSALSSQSSTEVYDLMGRRVEKMEKGIYVVNGKKVVIK